MAESVMVIVIVLVPLAFCWSVAVRVNVMVVLAATLGAVKVVDDELGSAKEMGSVGWSWDQTYVRVSSGSGSEAVPDRVTAWPSWTV